MANLGTSFPVYVTRKTAGGETMAYSYSLWMPLFAGMFVFLNAIAWGIIGLIVAVKTGIGIFV